MERHWDLKVGLTPGYWVTCHCCGQVHRANEICDQCAETLKQLQINHFLKAVKHVKEEHNDA